MAAQDIVNRVYREFKRYTGDGLPGEPINAPLPIGDPQSGVNNAKKSELRAALLAVLVSAGESVEDAAAILDDMLKRYLGAHLDDAAASAAAGIAIFGQLYFNTANGKFRVWNGSAWQDQSIALNNGDVTEPKLASSLANILPTVVASLLVLKALDTSRFRVATTPDGRIWRWKLGNYTSRVAVDISSGIFAKANVISAGTGCWVADIPGGKLPSSWFGALGDRMARTDGVATAGDLTFTAAGASWSAADVGKRIAIRAAGASGRHHYSTIASINSATSIKMAQAPAVTVASGANFAYGTDNYTPLQAWMDVAIIVGYPLGCLDAGDYMVGQTVKGAPYVSISSAGERWARIFPAMTAGPALDYDATTPGVSAGYHMVLSHVGFWGDDASGTAHGLRIGGNTKHMLVDGNWFYNFQYVDDGQNAVEFRGAGYNNTFERNHFIDNKRHFKAYRSAGGGLFPTASVLRGNIFEGSTEPSGTAVLFQDTAGFIFVENIMQSNVCTNALMVYDTAAQETSNGVVIESNWFEGNSVGVASSNGIYLLGDSKLLYGARVRKNSFHGVDPVTKIHLNGTDYARVALNSGGDPAKYGVRRAATNSNFVITGDGIKGTVDV